MGTSKEYWVFFFGGFGCLMKGFEFLLYIRNPLSCCTKIREELKFKVCYGFSLADSFGKKWENKTKKIYEKIEQKRKTEEKRGIIKKMLALFGL